MNILDLVDSVLQPAPGEAEPRKADLPDEPSLDIALDRYTCYPPESAVLSVRSPQDEGEVTVFIKIPETAEILGVDSDGSKPVQLKSYPSPDGQLISLTGDASGMTEFRLTVKPGNIFMAHYLTFSAWLPGKKSEKMPEDAARVRLTVKPNAEYLRYLPEIYSEDEFMNRYLMFFESFWKPISQQIGQMECYFDPDLTPEVFLPWLASWVGQEIDETFPKERVRDLIRMAIPFSHSRGTTGSLVSFLEMYSGGKVTVKELKAENMVLGADTHLGEGIALGDKNQPNTIEIILTVPTSELIRTGFTEEKYKKKIESFIRRIVPAHTIFTLKCNFKD